MAEASTSKKKNEPLAQGTGNSREGSHVDKVLEVFTVSIFFDGTRNNRFNTEAGLKSAQQRKRDISYQNYYSNIALLHDALEKQFDVHEKIYIEGAGTEKYQLDDSLGLGAAEGRTGLGTRVYEALTKLVEICKDKEIRSLIINVYGFSRGAAFARNFCYCLKNKAISRSPVLVELAQKTSINLVGIFDTVSSVGVGHYDDVKPLGLDIGRAEGIRRVVHLTAQNDYRYHFPLTSINGAVKDGIGFECSFPGAHSDVGGGYWEPWIEKDNMLSHKNMSLMSTNHIYYKWYLHKGYYTEGQIATRGHYPQEYIVGNRIVKLGYQIITAGIMCEIMKKEAGFVEGKTSTLKENMQKMQQVSVLNKFYIKAKDYVLSSYTRNGLQFKVPLLGSTEMKQIYNQFLHISLDTTGGTIINPANTGTPKSKERLASGNLNPMAPIRPKVTEGYR